MKFGKYTRYVEFLRDTSVTERDLIDMVNRRPYESGLCRYVTRHPACTVAVLDEMAQSDIWYVRLVGMFHAMRTTEQVERFARKAINDKHGYMRLVAKKVLNTDLTVLE